MDIPREPRIDSLPPKCRGECLQIFAWPADANQWNNSLDLFLLYSLTDISFLSYPLSDATTNKKALNQGYTAHFSNILGDPEFSGGCYLFTVLSSGLLFSQGAAFGLLNFTLTFSINQLHFFILRPRTLINHLDLQGQPVCQIGQRSFRLKVIVQTHTTDQMLNLDH